MGQGITITVSAETAAAAKRMQDFFAGATEGIQRMTGVGSFLAELGGKIAAAFTVGAIVNFTREQVNLEEEIGRVAQKTGLEISTLSALKEQAEIVGVNFGELNGSLGLFSDKVFGAVRQGGQAAQVFRDLGIQIVALDGSLRPTDAILSEVADRFQALPDGPQKAAAAMDLFGRAGRELIPILNEGSAGLERMKREGGGITPEQVAEATKFNQSVRELSQSFEGFFRELATKVIPKLQELVDWLQQGAKAANGLGESFKLFGAVAGLEFSKALVDGFVNAATVFGDLFINVAGAIAGKIDQLLVDAINKVINWFNASPLSTRFFGASIQPVERSDTKGQVAGEVEAMRKGAEILKGASDNYFNKWIEEAKKVYGITSAAKPPPPGAGGLPAGTDSAEGAEPFLRGQGQLAPISEEAKKLILDLDKAYAEATKGKMALLNAEQAEIVKKINEEILDRSKAAEEIQKVEEIYSRKRQELLNKERDAESEIALARIEGRRVVLSRDPTVTEVDKKQQLLVLLNQENDLLSKNITIKQAQVRDPQLNEESRLLAGKQLAELEQKQADLNLEQGRVERKGSFFGELSNDFVAFSDKLGTLMGNLAHVVMSPFQGLFEGLKGSIEGLINGTMRWGEALRNIGTSILKSVVSSFADMAASFITQLVLMGAKWVATHVFMAAVGSGRPTQAVAVTLQTMAILTLRFGITDDLRRRAAIARMYFLTGLRRGFSGRRMVSDRFLPGSRQTSRTIPSLLRVRNGKRRFGNAGWAQIQCAITQ